MVNYEKISEDHVTHMEETGLNPFMDEEHWCANEEITEGVVCQQLLRVTRPGGVLVVRTPYRENLEGYLSPNLPCSYVHVRTFDEKSLRLLFEKIHGSQVVEITKGPLLMPWVSLRFGLRVPGVGQLFRIAARASRLAGKSFHEAFLGWAFDPSEINVVVQVKANR